MAIQHPLQFDYDTPYRFSHFFAGSNQELIQQLQACAIGQGEQQIYFWGGQGQGKSHLLQACCQNAHLQQRSHFYLLLMPQSLPDPEILSGLENYELVCIDNIEALCGIKEWEHALFKFYNQHHELNNNLIMASSIPATSLNIALSDLKTRLNWGLSLKIKPLTDEQRITALSMKAQIMGLEFTPRTANYLLTRCARDLPTLWDFLDKIDHATLSAQRKPTIPLIRKILQEDQNI